VTSVALVFYEYFELEKEDYWNRLTLSVPDEEIRRAHYIINHLALNNKSINQSYDGFRNSSVDGKLSIYRRPNVNL
jgi:hypothetical protein